ncbi:hypothetical protein [Ferrimicrobium sp.]|uniref:hypothetical protein n=1 Tax=Ferrimicrobium sp. TaxID=2926050 RepID=UPI00260A03BA|nr:hypothetical protein [Ferrimicrobium sp.]
MGYRDHIVAKLSALAVAGGTTAMLFAATPVHTQFSATTTGNLNASGATVSQTLTNGNLKASLLVPSPSGATPSGLNSSGAVVASYTWTNSETVTLDNTGSVAEDFTLNISNVYDKDFAGNQEALEQLWVKYTAGGTTYYYPMFRGSNLPDTTTNMTEPTSGYPLPTPVAFVLGTVASGTTATATVAFALAPYASGEGGANAWNGATIDIPYTITAEPSAPTTQTADGTAPTLTATSAP